MEANNPFQPKKITFETAAEHATRNVPIVSPQAKTKIIRKMLEGQTFECASHIAVLDLGRFLGIIRIEDLLAALPDATAQEIMDVTPPVVTPGTDQEVAAWMAVSHGESALCVVGASGEFVGLIPPHRLLEVLLIEHEEDLSRLGGYLKNSKKALSSSQEALPKRFWHRIPWLIMGLLGSFLSADIVGSFETELQNNIILAFFIPAIVYLSDAVGTQTETVVVRGLSIGVGLRQIALREVLTGFFIGLALSLVSFFAIQAHWGNTQVALVVSVSIFAACTVATFIAMLLPWALDRFDMDPAFGSGPMATIIQYLLSILIYFLVTMVIMN